MDEDEYSSLETDVTDVEDLGLDDEDVNIDVEDQILLFDRIVHPPEYYQNGVEEFNENAFEGEDYNPGSMILLNAVEE